MSDCATAIWPISTETFFSDHSVYKFMFHSCQTVKCQLSPDFAHCQNSFIYVGDFIMKPQRTAHIQYDSQLPDSQQPDRKYVQWYCNGRLTNYTYKSVLAFHFSKSVLLLGSLWRGPGRLWSWITDAVLTKKTRYCFVNMYVNCSLIWLICNSCN